MLSTSRLGDAVKLGARLFSFILLIALLTGCGSNPTVEPTISSVSETIAIPNYQGAVSSVNTDAAYQSQGPISNSQDRSYRVGKGDVLDIQIYKVDKLSKQYHVDFNGNIQVTHIGGVSVAGLTAAQIENKLTRLLDASVLRNPQIDVTVVEHKSQRVTIAGAVVKPGTYNLDQGLNLYEVLSLAGGVSPNAGKRIYIKSTSGGGAINTKIVDINDMYNGSSAQAMQLQSSLNRSIINGGTTVLVESGGVVFIDGAIKKPGKYKLTNGLTVSQLIVESGDVAASASRSDIRILRVRGDNKMDVIQVDLDKIRNNQQKDIALQDNDIVTVGKSAFKAVFHGFFDYGLRLMFVSAWL